MSNIKKSDIIILRRRKDFLENRIRTNKSADTGFHYDRAEFGALQRVIDLASRELERRYGQEAVVQNNYA